MARLNMARSRVRPAICSLVRIDQTCFGRRGGLAPINLPLFQGSRREAWGLASVGSCIVVLLCYRGPCGCARRLLRYWMNVSCWIYPAVVCISPSIGTSQADPYVTLLVAFMKHRHQG